MKTYNFVATTPDGNIFEGDIVKISLRGANGDLAIMANHIPFITSVKPCNCKIELEDGTTRLLSTQGGILNVSDDKVTLMSGSLAFL